MDLQNHKEDAEKVSKIHQKYDKLKKLREHKKTLHIPYSYTTGEQIHFYSRFESGNLWRVVELLPIQTFLAIAASKQWQNRKEEASPTRTPEDFDLEYDLYL